MALNNSGFRKRISMALRASSAAVPVKPSIGVLDALEDTTVRGWFIGSPVSGGSKQRFRLQLDGVDLGTFEALDERPDVLDAEGELLSGFAIDLGPSLSEMERGVAALLDGERHQFGILTVDGALVAERSFVGTPPLRGFLDRVEETGLMGWAVNDIQPNSAVRLIMYVDGTPLMEVRTSQPRGDLSKKGIPGNKAGFSLKWPRGTFPAGSLIEVKFADGRQLAKSPVRVPEGPAIPETSSYLDAHRSDLVRPVTVIVPVYNAYEAVQDCLSSLARCLPAWANVLVINDASPDARVAPMLEVFAADPRFEVYTNPCNLGYTRSVNVAIKRAAERDVVLLNSDTVVTDRWLENMRYCAYSRARVATVTALSNNAGAFSVPEIGQENLVPENVSAEAFARSVVQAMPGRVYEVPTGNGFCMYIRRSAIRQIGLFDEEKYPRGYGEENDYCMRALHRGWKNLVCDKAFVLHKRSQSFQGEKVGLMAQGGAQVKEDYPEYGMLISRFRDVEFSRLRQLARDAVIGVERLIAKPRLMYVISTQTGGTPQTNLDLMRQMADRYECFLLRCDSKRITLSRLNQDALEQVEVHDLEIPIDPVQHRSDEYDRIALGMLYRFNIALLHIRHIGWHSLGLAEAAKSIDVSVVYSIHDFYSLCPSLNLLDQDLKYCGGNCTPGQGICQIGLWPADSFPSLKHGFVRRWRDMFREFLSHCDQLITTAPSVAHDFLAAYPECDGKLSIIPHGRDFEEMRSERRFPTGNGKVRVLVPGNVSVVKGGALIKRIVEIDREGRFEFHFLGNRWTELQGVGVGHGAYSRDDFAQKVAGIAPHIGIVFSLCPETYCHTLTEMWACGVPVVGLDVGAVGDRIRQSGAGWLLPLESTAEEILEQLHALLDDTAGYRQKVDAVAAWQFSEGLWNNAATMAMEYRRLYMKILADDVRSMPLRVGVLTGHMSGPGPIELGLADAVRMDEAEGFFTSRTVSPGWLLAGGVEHIDALILQADVVPEAVLPALIEAISTRALPYCCIVQAEGRTDRCLKAMKNGEEHSPSLAESLAAMLQGARTVVVENRSLAELVSHMGLACGELSVARARYAVGRPAVQKLEADPSLSPESGASVNRLLVMGWHEAEEDVLNAALNGLSERYPGLEILQLSSGSDLELAHRCAPAVEAGDGVGYMAWFARLSRAPSAALVCLPKSARGEAPPESTTVQLGLAGVPAVFCLSSPPADAASLSLHGLVVPYEARLLQDAVASLLDDEALREEIRARASEATLAMLAERNESTRWSKIVKHLSGSHARVANVDGRCEDPPHV